MAPTAAVVGAGPNGLAAAAVLARAGLEVTVYEAASTPGGAMRSAPLLGPGTVSDVGSSVHPMGVASPVFRALDLTSRGLEWLHPDVVLGHPLDREPAAVLHHDLERTARGLGVDGAMWRRLHSPVVDLWPGVVASALGPLVRIPPRPWALARFGIRAALPALVQARAAFRTERARALFIGSALHAVIPPTAPLTAAFGTLFGAAGHATGWPVARGGSQAIVDALVADLTAHGGRIETSTTITHLDQVRPADVVLLDLTPRQVLHLDGLALAPRERRAFHRYRYGTGVYNVHLLVDGAVPWRDPELAAAGTVHVGGTSRELARAEDQAARGIVPERPFVLVSQPGAIDATRAPAGQQVLWAYAHVPRGRDDERIGERILDQLERFAPGLRAKVLTRVDMGPSRLEAMDANLVGGDIGGGSLAGTQQVFRPRVTLDPYRLTADGVFLCSSSTPPGGGAHGMAGFHAAASALRRLHLDLPPDFPR